jgi:rare lipoprotein A
MITTDPDSPQFLGDMLPAGTAMRPKRFYARSRLAPLFLLIVALLLPGCSAGRANRSDPSLAGYTERGKASFYSMKFQFRKTASGERFNNYALTAAHKTLPFGTKVRVINVRNGKSVDVIINDRGPFVKGRIIDLTRKAFARIENIDKGLAQVSIKVVN